MPRPFLGSVSHAIQRGWQQPRALNRLLYPLSLVYVGLVLARRYAYRWRLCKRHGLPRPVVVVGNLSVGGVGKTPLVIALVAQLKARGMTPGVIARGYGGHSPYWPREVTEDTTAAEVGDEPLLIFRRCRVPVVVGASRVASGRLLIANHRCDVVISDDGFQHFAMARTLDIVVIDGERGLGNGWCLPAGALREPPRGLNRANLVVVNGDLRSEDEFPDGVRAKMKMSGGGRMRVQIQRAVRMGGIAESQALRQFADQPVHAVAGIGHPQRFFAALQAQGLRVIPHAFPDHHAFTPADFAFTVADTTVLMTEKDAVKCAPLLAAGTLNAACWMVPLEIELPPDLVDTVVAAIQTANSA